MRKRSTYKNVATAVSHQNTNDVLYQRLRVHGREGSTIDILSLLHQSHTNEYATSHQVCKKKKSHCSSHIPRSQQPKLHWDPVRFGVVWNRCLHGHSWPQKCGSAQRLMRTQCLHHPPCVSESYARFRVVRQALQTWTSARPVRPERA